MTEIEPGGERVPLLLASNLPAEVAERVREWYRSKRWKNVRVAAMLLGSGDLLRIDVRYPRPRQRGPRQYTLIGPVEDTPRQLEQRARAFRALAGEGVRVPA